MILETDQVKTCVYLTDAPKSLRASGASGR
jgi:hypothetical protein